MKAQNQNRLEWVAAADGGEWRAWWGAEPLPPGVVALGVVTRVIGGYEDTGALLWVRCAPEGGQAVQGRAGALENKLPAPDGLHAAAACARRAAGLTHDQAARAVGVTLATWMRWSSGRAMARSVAVQRQLAAFVDGIAGNLV